MQATNEVPPKERIKMTSQLENPAPRQDDDDLLENLVVDQSGEATAEEIIAVLDRDPLNRRPLEKGPGLKRSNDVPRQAPGRSIKATPAIVRPPSNKVIRRLRRSDSKDRQ